MAIDRFSSGGTFEESVGYSRLVVGRSHGGATAWTAGTTSLINGVVQHPGDAFGQALVAFQASIFALERAGFSRDDVVSTRMYVVDLPQHAEAVGRAHAQLFSSVLPAATMVGTPALIDPGLLVEVELVAWQSDGEPAA